MSQTQHAAERSLHNQTSILPKKQLIPVLATLALPLLITFIDQNGIGVTLPTIAQDLRAEDSISWAGTTSLIANTAFQMLYGRLSDIFGRKVVFLSAITCLAGAAILCGFARNAAWFYIFRGIAGIGGGGIANLSMIIISDVVSLEKKGYYQGIFGTFIGLGNVLGPFLAAAFVARATWRAFFWTTGPLAAIIGIVSIFVLPSTKPTLTFKESVKKIDYGGVLFLLIGVIFLLIPIGGGDAYFSFQSPMVISMLSIGSASLIVFVLWEWKVAKLPMIPLNIFRNPAICVLLAQNFLLGGVYQSYLYYLPLYLQNARRLSVMQSAGIIASLVGVQAVSSIGSAYYISRFQRWKEVICTGFSLWTLGSGLTLLYGRHTSLAAIIGPLILIGIGVGFIFQPMLTALQSHVTRSRRAIIISNRNFFRCAGGATGLAVSAAILQEALKNNLPAEYQNLANTAYSLPKVDNPWPETVLNAYMAASRAVFILQVPIIGMCLLGSVFVKDRGLALPEEQDETASDKEPASK